VIEETYYPPPESSGGWRWTDDERELAGVAGVDPELLSIEFRREELLYGGDSWGVVVIRNGWLAGEHYTFNVATTTRFDVWSATKSMTALGWGLMLDAEGSGVALDSPIYELIPDGSPLSDLRKRSITIGHVLSMTSGIRGEDHGIYGMPSSPDTGIFEVALGRSRNRYGISTAELAAGPGTAWDYSDPAYCHLALAFPEAAGEQLGPFVGERILEPIGVEQASWEQQGGRGFIGPYTNAHTGFIVSARELARIGYLVAKGGEWEGRQVVPASWLELATSPSQPFNRGYGYGWWTNQDGHYGDSFPRDLVAMSGYRSNRCYVIPSLDLVVARVGGGPVNFDESVFLAGILRALD
jgi:CubicO group peptidase (beta-lactamase class C family)